MSNDTVKYSSTPTFNGPGWAVNAVNGCKAGNCDIGVPHNYNTLPATNPLQVLDTESFNTRTGNTKPCGTSHMYLSRLTPEQHWGVQVT